MSGLLVSDIVKMGARQLEEAGIYRPKSEASDIFCWLKNVDKSKFIMEWGESVDDRTVDLYLEAVSRRCKRIPLQYITGRQNFMGYDFKTAENVLIPRLDSEVVVEKALEIASDMKIDSVLDLCCGSGIMGITIGLKLRKVKVAAVDISKDAVELTKLNAQEMGMKVDARQGNLYEPIKSKRYSMIISNPPYIRSDVIPTLMPEVKDYEPIEALDGGESGLDFYGPIISEAHNHLKKDGLLVLEIGHDQSAAVEQMLMDTGKFHNIQTFKDLDGKDRVVTAVLIGKGK